MSNDWYQDIVDFHREVMLDEIPTKPRLPSDKHRLLRERLIKEEVQETLEAICKEDLVGIADGIADSIVVLLGTAVMYGIPMHEVWNEVHKTNMAKKDGPMRADGKRLKPEGWRPPNIEGILKEYIE